MHYSPLRYPGGKGKLQAFMELIIEQTGHVGGTYIEPFAGGAGIALGLLEKNIVNNIVINDLDKNIATKEYFKGIVERIGTTEHLKSFEKFYDFICSERYT